MLGSPGTTTGAPVTGPCTVLVVDDERDLADLAQALLELHGFIVRVAYDAPAALRILEQDSTIDAVFSDIMMPVMTGVALAHVIHLRYPHIRVVLTSGYAPPALFHHHPRHNAFIGKPYQIDAVIELLH